MSRIEAWDRYMAAVLAGVSANPSLTVELAVAVTSKVARVADAALAERDKRFPGAPLDIVFDGPPGPEAGRFVEVERDGRSVKAGEWMKRADGYWVLRLRVDLL